MNIATFRDPFNYTHLVHPVTNVQEYNLNTNEYLVQFSLATFQATRRDQLFKIRSTIHT